MGRKIPGISWKFHGHIGGQEIPGISWKFHGHRWAGKFLEFPGNFTGIGGQENSRIFLEISRAQVGRKIPGISWKFHGHIGGQENSWNFLEISRA